MFNELSNVLQKESQLILKLNEMAEMKSEALIKENMNAINEIIEIEQNLESELNALENKRGSITEEIAVNFEACEDMGIFEIIENAKEPVKARLLDLKNEIENGFDKLKRINEINSEIIRMNLNYIEYMINSIFSNNRSGIYAAMRTDGTHGAACNSNAEGFNRLFDNKV